LRNTKLDLKNTLEIFQAFFKDLPIVMTLYNSEGELIEVNKACLDLMKVSDVEEIREFNILNDLNMPIDEKERLAKGETVNFELIYDFDKVKENLSPKISGIFYFDAIINPIYLGLENSTKYYLVHVRNITEHKIAEQKLKDSKERYNILFKNFPLPTYVWQKKDNSLILIDHNIAGEKITSGGIKNFLGITATKLYNNRPDILEDLHHCINKKTIFSKEMKYTFHTHKEEKILNVTYCFIPPDIVLVHTEDVSNWKVAEQKLKISETKYREAYNRANFYKDLFAHDINNILQNILSASELSSIYINNVNQQEKLYEAIDIVKDQVKKGAGLISKVRKLSEMEESQIPLESTEINDILKESIEFAKKSFQERDITIHIDSFSEMVFFKVNSLVSDFIENIIINSISHNRSPKVELNIKISKMQQDGINYIKMEFVDNGIGVPDDQIEFIFRRKTDGYESGRGMGLGLSLVKKIIESYNGKIWVENRIKDDHTKGSNFIVLIPEAM